MHTTMLQACIEEVHSRDQDGAFSSKWQKRSGTSRRTTSDPFHQSPNNVAWEARLHSFELRVAAGKLRYNIRQRLDFSIPVEHSY